MLSAAFIVTATLAVLPAAGSSDPLDYAAYGRMVGLGHNPYQMTPGQLGQAGDPVGKTAPRSWQRSHSDYGPLASLDQATAAQLGGFSLAEVDLVIVPVVVLLAALLCRLPDLPAVMQPSR